MSDSAFDRELRRRLVLWSEVKALRGPSGLEPHLVKQLRIHVGQQGVFRDAELTSKVAGNQTGITVGLLHTGRVYADDLSDEGLIYHYPETARGSRDAYEIAATKACGELGLPLFVVITPPEQPYFRDVRLGWVRDFSDEAQQIDICFSEAPYPPVAVDNSYSSEPFVLRTQRTFRISSTKVRPNQAQFRFRVMKYYGAGCAVCGIRNRLLLDAAHLCPVAVGGTDDPRNGLVFCLNHHRAFDKRIFGIHPDSLEIYVEASSRDHSCLSISRKSLLHLDRKPHPQALEWAWASWRGKAIQGISTIFISAMSA